MWQLNALNWRNSLLRTINIGTTLLWSKNLVFYLFPPYSWFFKLRINARSGGCNSFSDSGLLAGLQSQPFMIVGKSFSSWRSINTNKYLGADVGHPGPGVAKPSVTGLVFSYDEGATIRCFHGNTTTSSWNHWVVAEDDGASARGIYQTQ